ncbi:MAG: DUF6577 family protein [Bacteroidota bacterium]
MDSLEQLLKNKFGKRNIFSREELWDFFRENESDLKKSTFGWRIHNLKNRQVLTALGGGRYTLESQPSYEPKLSPTALEIASIVASNYAAVQYCVWETNWLNEFTLHQTTRSMLIVEIEKEYAESLFYLLKDNIDSGIFLNPGRTEIELYIPESNHPVIIKKFISRSPVQSSESHVPAIKSPSIEKILVDIYAEKKLFTPYQGSELLHIFRSAFETYLVNTTRMLSYARRRETQAGLEEFMKEHFPQFLKVDSI